MSGPKSKAKADREPTRHSNVASVMFLPLPLQRIHLHGCILTRGPCDLFHRAERVLDVQGVQNNMAAYVMFACREMNWIQSMLYFYGYTCFWLILFATDLMNCVCGCVVYVFDELCEPNTHIKGNVIGDLLVEKQ